MCSGLSPDAAMLLIYIISHIRASGVHTFKFRMRFLNIQVADFPHRCSIITSDVVCDLLFDYPLAA